ncbi:MULTISPECIES: peptide-methionine (S)-S-oxide reductase MsrA [unclassified Acidisoma]|jgi:peptide-methionine (S)-S-oxide reductase|uniref:peptide-methionine (S)-S-oxide reductase MsrA n=1 Tax=unclassified Acidisoma TaxID=2634065 RepID=UPI00131C74AF|nr:MULTISPECIES: peptide-methionine (S)-S-oxide reductase MsrA [unclassified Acidisoma]
MSVEQAVLGGGCFWCTEAVFQELNGVSDVQSGYAGGQTPSPTYEQICTGRTGHAEVVRVSFDPEVLSFADLLRVFFTTHDPTSLNRQGNDVGTQYRSTILVTDDAQAKVAREVIAEFEANSVWGKPIVTTIEPLRQFFPAEREHDDYYSRNPNAGYCRVVIAPKVAKVRKEFTSRLRKPAAA